MNASPLQFAREFEKLKSDVSQLPAADLKLLQLALFWERLAPLVEKSAYESYLSDYRSLVVSLVRQETLVDLTPDSLRQIRHVLDDLVAVTGVDGAPTELLTVASAVTLRMATLYFYVGAVDEALSLCVELTGGDDIALPSEAELRGLSPLDTLRTVYEKYRRDHTELGNLLQTILAHWEETALAVEHDRVYCLFVDKDGKGNATTGRMRLLRGTVEHISARKGSGLPPDQVAFDNQVKTPNDPFVGVAYDSLKAARLSLRNSGFGHRAEGSLRAFLSIDGTERSFTGDSIGLAVALVAFTQLLKPEVMRQERFIASDIAVTGSIDTDGRILPVNDDTLPAKIERAFFSHVRYVVVPEANLAAARDTVKHLHKQYPRRRLSLIHSERLDELLDDRNIIRSEKVCLGEFVAKKAARYSRLARVQVPLLIGLLAIAFLLYADYCPKCWPQGNWFDWNPEYVRLTERGFEALNKDSVPVWDVGYECEGISADSKWDIGDLDENGTNEVAFLPQVPHSSSSQVEATLFVYRGDGEILFERPSNIGDTCLSRMTEQESAFALCAKFLRFGDEVLIVTKTGYYRPGSEHVRIWDASGNLLASYVNSGFSGPRIAGRDIPGQPPEVVFLSMNNPMVCASLYSLEVDSCDGVSPPYVNRECEASMARKSCQSGYMLFPRSAMNREIGDNYNRPFGLAYSANGSLLAHVNECGTETGYLTYYIDRDLRVYRVEPDDNFTTRRDAMVAEGKLAAIPWPEYLKQKRDSVTYWTDSGWVTEGQLRAAEDFSE